MATETDRGPEIGRVKRGSEELTVFRIPEHVRTAHGPDGGTVLDIHHGQMFRVNFVASRILELMRQGLASPAIAEQLAREFGIDRVRAQTDVHEFIETLANLHLAISQNTTPLSSTSCSSVRAGFLQL